MSHKLSYWLMIAILFDVIISVSGVFLMQLINPYVHSILPIPRSRAWDVEPKVVFVGIFLSITHVALLPNLMGSDSGWRKLLGVMWGISLSIIAPLAILRVFAVPAFFILVLTGGTGGSLVCALASMATCLITVGGQKVLSKKILFPPNNTVTLGAALMGGVAWAILRVFSSQYISPAVAIPVTTVLAGVILSWFWLGEIYRTTAPEKNPKNQETLSSNSPSPKS